MGGNAQPRGQMCLVLFCVSRFARPRLLDLISQALQKSGPSPAGAERIDSRMCFVGKSEGLFACTGFHSFL